MQQDKAHEVCHPELASESYCVYLDAEINAAGQSTRSLSS
jgi:hypothetical protein